MTRMTKRSKRTHISDSASRGKGESMATESRWDELRKWIDMHEADRLDDGLIELHVTEDDLQELLLSECSRLASRVEELEYALKICRYFIRREHFKNGDASMPDSHLAEEADQLATKVLAGTHAEEKE